MIRVPVDLNENSYDIYIGSDILGELGEICAKKKVGEKAVIITDSLVNKLYGNVVRSSLKGAVVGTLEVPQGEQYKTLDSAIKLYNQLVELKVQRDFCIVALGGGVIGDLAGFVAATYMRGVNLVMVPTTLLAQVDASVGGKTAVNHPKCKNLIGVFYQPKLVLTDIKALTTLPEKEVHTGLAEIVKYGVIHDADLFKFVEANVHHLNTKAFGDKETSVAALRVWQTIITESCKIKAKIVSLDEKERGLRMILNFGHTIGHAVETIAKYRKYTHGEAVGIGMVCASSIAEKIGLLSKDLNIRIKDLIEKIGLPTQIKGIKAKTILAALTIDKKVREGKIQFVLPTKLGKVELKNDVPLTIVKKVLKEVGCQ